MLLLLIVNVLSYYTSSPVDTLLFSEKLKTPEQNQMSYPTMFTFGILSLCFLLITAGKFKFAQLLCSLMFFLSLMVFIAYIFGERPFYLIPGKIPMALNTSVSFMMLSTGTALIYPRKGFAYHFTAKTTGARMARIFIPMSFLFVLLLGLLRLEFVGLDLDLIEKVLAVTAAITIMIFISVIYYFTAEVNISHKHLEIERERVHHLNRKLFEKNHELLIKNDELEKFVQSVSHDIRSPLSGIINSSKKLLFNKEEFTVEESEEILKLIIETSDSVMERTSQMLELAKAARKPIRKTHVNSGFIVDEVVREIKAGPLDKEIEVEIRGLPVVNADKALLKSVFYNLINNAIKYSKGKAAKIMITCKHKGREKIFSVKDNGIGIDMKSISKLFKAFSRLSDSGTGTGLGLSIVKRIIERHGGRVWARPGEKGGAVFYFSLPSK